MCRFQVAAIFFLFFAIASAEIDNRWRNFKLDFNKTYKTSAEEEKRLKIFEENLKFFETHNKKYEKGDASFRLGMNRYTDFTDEEIEAKSKVPKGFVVYLFS